MQHIVIIGGGFSGLSAAWYARKKGAAVTLIEAQPYLGGLAYGFSQKEWTTSLEFFYHHLFKSDRDIRQFANEIGFYDIDYYTPLTASAYELHGQIRLFALDSPLSLLKFPLLPCMDRLRTGLILLFLKLMPYTHYFSRTTSYRFLTRWMGKKSWFVLWEQLFRKKFGKFAENISLAFFWARIKARTRALGYPKGGFKSLVEHTEHALSRVGVTILKNTKVEKLYKDGDKFKLQTTSGLMECDKVIVTTPTKLFEQFAGNLLPAAYKQKLASIKHLGAINLVIESPEPILKKVYWANICVPDIPMVVLVQHTNLVGTKGFNGKHIAYVGNYLETTSSLFTKSEGELLSYFLPHIHRINPAWSAKRAKIYVFKAANAQPIYDTAFSQDPLTLKTPVAGLFIANIDTTYPYDRGTNFAVKVGRKAAELAT